MIVREIEKIFINELSVLYEFEEARNLAWLAVSHICKVSRIQYLAIKQHQLSPVQESSLMEILRKLNTGEPIQYIIGETEFYGLPFRVNSSVLIPRPETEELVDWIIKDLKSGIKKQEDTRILDIGTGSGCIPITLKKYLSNTTVTGIDVSLEAIDIARQNSVINNTEVSFYKVDLFDMVQPEIVNGIFEIIVSNPPYVTLKEKDQMHQNVLDFEPHLALFVSDDNPLEFYQGIAEYANKHLAPDGKLYLEINENLGDETVELLHQNLYVNIELRSDLRNRNRMIKAEKQ